METDIYNKLFKILTQNEKENICTALCECTSDIKKIKDIYNIKFNRDLIYDIKNKTKDNTKRFLIGLFLSETEYDCYNLKKATRHIIYDYDIIIDILATRTTDEILQIKKCYMQMYPDDCLAKKIDTGEIYFSNILFGLLCGERANCREMTDDECKKFADFFFRNEIVTKNDIKNIYYYFVKQSVNNFKKISQYYFKVSGKTILDYVKNEFSGNLKKCLIAVIYGLLSPHEYFYNKLVSAIEKKDSRTVIRILFSRKNDLKKIEKLYVEKKGKNIFEEIKNIINIDNNLFNKVFNDK